VNQLWSHSPRAISSFQHPQYGMLLENVFAFVNSNARRFVDDYDFIILEDNL
jgi:hypothetical protein